jgi:hypothetical protein
MQNSRKISATCSFVRAVMLEEFSMHSDSGKTFFMKAAGQLSVLFLTVVNTGNPLRASSILNSSHNKILV